MIHVLLACRNSASMSDLQTALNAIGVLTTCLESGNKALSALSEKHFDLLVADETLGDMSGLELIESVIKVQPMLNCAAVSSLSSDDFHQVSEGLGILMQLPVKPSRNAADQLLEHLNRIQSITAFSASREK